MTVQVITTVTSAAPDDALIDLEEIKTELKIADSDTSNDDWLNRAIGQVSRSIMSYCNRRFHRETLRDDLFLQQDPFSYQVPGGVVSLQLSRFPVLSLDSVVQTRAVNNTKTLTVGTDFVLDSVNGRLLRISVTGGTMLWEAYPTAVTYVAGFDEIPDDVAVAALRWMVWRWNERSRDPTLKATQQPDYGTRSYWVGGPPMSGGVPQEIAALLDNYRVPVIY
jgi:hypothetical protein